MRGREDAVAIVFQFDLGFDAGRRAQRAGPTSSAMVWRRMVSVWPSVEAVSASSSSSGSFISQCAMRR
jgi:hypothetical protein